ncbi:MAG TPA: hypothetical protein DHV48_15600 [Prolixibacteraceae bacterium]|nr:MAG: hypothetical protein A2066_17830 [Bacteroidetes bacterium GWB2_41_8]HCY42751.1 hypothetical protein [Prolixibacteraceae bacterium]
MRKCHQTKKTHTSEQNPFFHTNRVLLKFLNSTIYKFITKILFSGSNNMILKAYMTQRLFYIEYFSKF